MRRRRRVAIGMTVEAGHAEMPFQRPSVLRGVELRLRERADQQPQALQLLRIENVLEQFVKIRHRYQLSLAHIAEVRPRRQEYRCGELRQKVLRQVEIQIEPRQVAVRL